MAERNMINITITLLPEERRALRRIAADMDLTVSGLVREWLKEHQEKEAQENDKEGHTKQQ